MPNAFAADIADMPGKKRGKKAVAVARKAPGFPGGPAMKKSKGAKVAKKVAAKKGKPPFGY